jgi:oxygen-independent coproporphyrinogen-3 oxidase
VTRDYLAAVTAGRPATLRGFALGAGDRLRAALIERLMCDFRVDIAEICGRHGATVGVVADAMPALDRLAADGIVRRDGMVVEMAPGTRNLVRIAAAAFDAYRAGATAIHSRAV